MSSRFFKIVATCVAAAVLCGSGTVSAKPKDSTPEERAKAVQLAHELEAQATSDDAVEKRRWLIDFYQRVPDITITVCDLLGRPTTRCSRRRAAGAGLKSREHAPAAAGREG